MGVGWLAVLQLRVCVCVCVCVCVPQAKLSAVSCKREQVLWSLFAPSCARTSLTCLFFFPGLPAPAAGLQVPPEFPDPRRSQEHSDQPGPPGVRITGGSEEEGERRRVLEATRRLKPFII